MRLRYTITVSPITIRQQGRLEYSRSDVMRTPRRRKAVAVLCIALVVCAAFVPSVASTLGAAILVPLWLVLPAVAAVVVRRTAFRCDEQPVALLAILASRAPPTAPSSHSSLFFA